MFEVNTSLPRKPIAKQKRMCPRENSGHQAYEHKELRKAPQDREASNIQGGKRPELKEPRYRLQMYGKKNGGRGTEFDQKESSSAIDSKEETEI